MIFLTGGARSGKSALAARLATNSGAPVRLVVTARVDDEEMAARVDEHRRRRPENWTVVEAPVDLPGAIRGSDPNEALIVDCITLWVSNLMEGHDDLTIEDRVGEAVATASGRSAPTIVVSNEVGSGLVPMHPLGRRFRDLQGRANQRFANRAEAAFLVVAGRALRLDPWSDAG